jgi:hypothetical protein
MFRIVDFLIIYFGSVMDDDFSGLPQDYFLMTPLKLLFLGVVLIPSYRTFLKNSVLYMEVVFTWRRRKKKRDRRPKSVFRETTTLSYPD